MSGSMTLMILAAGIGSRFGGVKQLKPVGPAGEIIMDYSVYDAVRAGFDRILFIIRREIEADFRAIIGDRLEAVCGPLGVRIDYAYQELTDLPRDYPCPPERTRPWGTGHALLACRGMVDGPFVVINADDYYGKAAFSRLRDWLRALPDTSAGQYCVAGFRLGNTLSDFGGVTRGICRVDEHDRLRRIEETRNIIRTPEGGARVRDGQALDTDSCVSMNMWGFTPDLLETLEERFCRFLAVRREEPGAEFLLPEVVDQLLAEGLATVQVLPTSDQWFGMTYQEDVPKVVSAFRSMTAQGIYRPGLYK